MRRQWSAVAGLLVVVLAACSGSGPASARGRGATADLTVYAAASLKTALDRVKTAYEAATPGTTISISTDSSAALETKIEQGAPADVFLSADMTNPQRLVDGGFASGDVVPFAGNQLTVIVPESNPAGITKPADLARRGIKIVAAGVGVPIQKYAESLVANLARQPGYPSDFVNRYEANIVSREDNVGAVLAKVALGEGDAGIVYVTDARSSPTVTAIAVPAAANVPATYGGVVVKASPSQAAAGAFLAWLAGPQGQSILASLGFLPAP